jgi:hypothetical protein
LAVAQRLEGYAFGPFLWTLVEACQAEPGLDTWWLFIQLAGVEQTA